MTYLVLTIVAVSWFALAVLTALALGRVIGYAERRSGGSAAAFTAPTIGDEGLVPASPHPAA